jgi:arylsulfatase A
MLRCLLSISLFLVYGLSFGQQKNKRPNVIYIYADDLGYGELGIYGQKKIHTPNLDQMAREGMRFTNHYTGAPVCAPARCILLTGRHSGHSYIRGNYELGGFEDDHEGGQMPLPAGSFTIGHLMQKAGYITAAIGKWGLGMSNSTGDPNLQGFDYFYGYLDQKQAHNHYPTHLWENGKWDTLQNKLIQVHKPLPLDETDTEKFNAYKGKDYALDKMVEKTFAFIDQYQQQPFFLYLAFPSPHLSLQVPDQALQEYAGRFNDQPYHGENGYAASEYPRATYAAMISYMDKQIGRLFEKLKDLGLDEQTIVMFSSDNGTTFNVGGVDADFFNSLAGLRGRKQDLYEGGIREPFIARWPGKIPKGIAADLVSAQYDLMPTLAELTGIPIVPGDGISFLQTLVGSKKQVLHDYLYFEFPEKSGQVAIRMGDWKAVKSDMKKNRQAPWELYNLKSDPAESKDLSNDYPTLLKKFDAILEKEHQPAHIREWEFVVPKF